MKFSKLSILLFWCYIIAISQVMGKNDSDYNKSTILISIIKTDIWKHDIGMQDIILRRKVTNLWKHAIKYKHFNNIAKLNTNDNNTQYLKQQSESETLRVFSEIANVLYLSLKCKYSNIIINFLQFIFEMISSCSIKNELVTENECINDIILHLIKQQKYFVKMIFELFMFIDYFPNLKYSGQELLKSLMSINLFSNFFMNYRRTIYYSRSQNFGSEKNVIAQINNFVERFRCKNCPINVNHDFENNKKNKDKVNEITKKNDVIFSEKQWNEMSAMFNKYFEQIVIADSSDPSHAKNSKFKEEMYDTEYLVFKHIINNEKYSNIGTLMVASDEPLHEPMLLKELFKNALKTYSIKTIFDFQKLFVNVILDLCHIQFHNFNDSGVLGNGKILQTLLTNTMVFTKILLPVNHPKNVANSLQLLYNTILQKIEEHLSGQNKEKTILGRLLLNKLRIITIQNWEKYKFLKNFPISSLIQDVLSHKYFNSFIQYFNLLLSEPNTLEEYRLFDMQHMINAKAGSVCLAMSNLRENLILFEALKSKRSDKVFKHYKNNGTNATILRLIQFLNTSLAYLYKEHIESDEIKKIILPISMHFKNAAHSSEESSNGFLLKQQLLLTINLIEYFEINNCAVVHFNFDMVMEILDDKNLLKFGDNNIVVGFDETYIEKRLKLSLVHPEKEDKQLTLTWVNKFIPNDFSLYYNSQFNSKTINWDGSEYTLNDVLINIKHGVIDYNDLIRFKVFKIKWFIFNLFKKILYVLVNRNKYSESSRHTSDTSNIITMETIKSDVSRFRYLQVPGPIKVYLLTVLNEFSKTTANNYLDYMSMIKNELNYLGIDTYVDTFDQVYLTYKGINDNDATQPTIYLQTISNELVEDHNFLKEFLNNTNTYDINTLMSTHSFIYIY